MGLNAILIFSLVALVARWLIPPRWLGSFILAASLLAVYMLQPSSPVRSLDFWLPTLSIGLTLLVWVVCYRLAVSKHPDAEPAPPAPTAKQTLRQSLGRWISSPWSGGALIAVLIMVVGLSRYTNLQVIPSRPPSLPVILAGLVIFGGLAVYLSWAAGRQARVASGLILLIILLLVVLKTPGLSLLAGQGLRRLNGQPAHLATPLDLAWIGFSYLAFRLIHALREAQMGKLPAYRLSEFTAYALFFPAFTAGPIDRAPRWINELRQVEGCSPSLDRRAASLEYTVGGGQRILIGAFKKFVLADSLALFALNAQNASQVNTSLWTWVLLLAYSLRIYLDFSGYTDIAIGLGQVMGIHLPENFDRPYTRPNLTAFWNSWHITLAQWFRAYYFNPLTRWLRSRPAKPPAWLVILITQLSTMILIGLWHGITWNFVIWGAWHGAGLFTHNRYSEWARPHLEWLETRPRLKLAANWTGWLVTFLFVSLGWVWFALPDPASALAVFGRLFDWGG
jgi:alginate O-acetyltransferase complex protein AlgI